MKHLVQNDKIGDGIGQHAPRMKPFTTRPMTASVNAVVAELDAQPELWNQHTMRKGAYVHSAVDDIWVRYRDLAELKGRTQKQFIDQVHTCVWYPAWKALPSLLPLVFGLANVILATQIGGILITRIPAGHRVGPHSDLGFNARHYRKFCICLKANEGQSFEFDGEKMLAISGEAFEFDNRFEHWVENPTDEERMSLIVSLTAV